jgi:hypothetical protein
MARIVVPALTTVNMILMSLLLVLMLLFLTKQKAAEFLAQEEGKSPVNCYFK